MERSKSAARHAWACAAMAVAMLVAGCASRPARVPVTVEEIVQMSRDGQPAADIIARMEASDTVYRLSGSELARLKERGVPDEVLDYMQDTYVDYERSRVVRSYDPWWGPPYAFGYPYWGYYGPYYRPYYYPYRHPHRHRAPKARTQTPSPPAASNPPSPAPQLGIRPQGKRPRSNIQVR